MGESLFPSIFLIHERENVSGGTGGAGRLCCTLWSASCSCLLVIYFVGRVTVGGIHSLYDVEGKREVHIMCSGER